MPKRLLAMPPHVRGRLAEALESGLLAPPYSVAALRAVGITEDAAEAVDALEALDRLGITGRGAAACLAMMDEAASRSRQPDLVWSGPEVTGLHARDTRRVYEELLSSAERSIWAATYAFFDGPKAFEVISARMDSTPTLDVMLLLNIERKYGDTTSADALVRRFADRFWGDEWPGDRRPNVFYDPRALELPRPKGVLHAKAVVKDDEAVFITSANLTEAALDRNIELGLLVRDPALAATVVMHFRGLIERGLLKPLPGA
ncbi:MAG: phospholipase [Actinobacteria bacterium]|nr:phospholipase [Actinomycetota bacterium]